MISGYNRSVEETPIATYPDASMNEQGIRFFKPDGHGQFFPWHRVRFYVLNKFLVFAPEDEQGIEIRSRETCLNLRINLKDHPQVVARAVAFQKAYLESPENQYACKIDQRSYIKNKRGETIFLALYAFSLPAYLIYMMIQGHISAPDNDPGVRYQNGTMIAIIMTILSTLLVYWLVYKARRRKRMAPAIIEINQLGVITHESEYPWDTLKRIDQCFAQLIVTTQSGQELLLAENCCATCIVRNRILQIPVFGYKLFLFFLCGGVISGPLVSAWFQYLVPEYEQPFGPMETSALVTAMVLVMFGFVYWEVWIAKRHQSKSQ